jgi:hypothetical protein
VRRAISKWMSENAFVGPRCRTLLDRHTPSGPVTVDIAAYHVARREERAPLVSALQQDLPLDGLTVCSVGAGAGGEESLLSCQKLTLIEPDPRYAAFLRDRYAHVIEAPYEGLNVPSDLIYASGLGPWMNADPMRGIDVDFEAFCRRNLRPNGVVVALIYGGLHTQFVLDRLAYLRQLTASTRFTIALYGKYRPSNALLVLSDAPRTLPQLSALIDVLIENDRIVKSAPRVRAFAAWCAVGLHVVRNMRAVIAEAYYLLRANRRLR